MGVLVVYMFWEGGCVGFVRVVRGVFGFCELVVVVCLDRFVSVWGLLLYCLFCKRCFYR